MARNKLSTTNAILAIGAVGVLCVVAVMVAMRTARPERYSVVEPRCAGPKVKGIDVSYYQEAIDWRRVRKSGVLFAFIRVSDGTTVADPRFTTNWADAKRAQVMRGAYQFFRPAQSAIEQADLLIAAIQRDRGELPPVIDVETSGGVPAAQLVAAVTVWLDRVRTKLGVEPILYTAPLLWGDFARDAPEPLRATPLWVAHYTSGCPLVPAPWTAWTFWQYSDHGEVPGIKRPTDLNFFFGTFDDLEAFARAARR